MAERVTAFLEAVAAVRERFIEFERALTTRPEVSRTRSGIECRRYDSGLSLEMWVEAELMTGGTVGWLLEIGRKDQWMIDSSVTLNRGQWQEVIAEFPEKQADDHRFPLTLRAVLDRLIESEADLNIVRSYSIRR